MSAIGTASPSSSAPISRSSPFTGSSSIFTLEDRPRDPPANLTRFAPDRRDWVLYDTAQNNEFLLWWLETDYGRRLTKNGRYNFRWSVESHSSKVWKQFDQVAELRSGRPKVICRSCFTPLNHPHHPHHKSHGTSTMGKHLKSKSCRRSVEKESVPAATPGPTQAARASLPPIGSRVTKTQLKDQLLRTISSAQLTFELVEEPTFRELLDLVYAGPQLLDIPSSKQLRQHMHDTVTTYQESQLQDLPGDSKVSIALCCWKSPLGQDFMAITAYYFDKQWSYREVLLGFELLCRPETGTDAGNQILGLIEKKGLLRRIFSVTIDYRVDANLVLSLQEKLISSGGISSLQLFVGVPGIVQAVQLCLERYLQNITNDPERGTVETECAISCGSGSIETYDAGIASILEKLYASPYFCEKKFDAEWRKIEYVVQVTMPFVHFTMFLLASKDATIHRACLLFETLMVQIDKSIEALGGKSALWKQKLRRALVGMKMELREIHEKTFEDFGVMYGTGTLIAPQYKVSAFDGARPSCLGHAERYIEYLKIFHLQYRPQMPTSLSCLHGMSCSPQLLELEQVLHPLTGLVANSMSQNDEVGQYLREGAVNISPRAYWKDHQREWPVLTRLARDLLSIPATGAGTERLFAVAENIYHLYGGHLDEPTMRDLVMYTYSEKSKSDKQLVNLVDHNTVGDEEWEEFGSRAERPEPISDEEWTPAAMSVDERSEDDGNSHAATVILESPPTDDLEQHLGDKGDDSSLFPPVTWLINRLYVRHVTWDPTREGTGDSVPSSTTQVPGSDRPTSFFVR
ncbi:hypothetical protein N7541_009530 [Penicillium brevicompactum]|uniref:HAT C-terminal dimerisation domain-containing protein n=1 Tax=Penicillium brevicompactum TaxID=5074 RepID=A0A9W9QM11_PENBR|nr:hypothetical protein N7541_009530 [Penicillium brevicompactum]